ncbi:ribonuclease HII [Chitinibacter bivalviorum]|uniref:Ribonuclease HII n=1 Tax=Chitinibacter bivalviorum TaxID=2739434 RepID=A0A7H9BMQ1_9NEIS|nr:ribonuclease HII [Chitinibacter bivalviorum]QLG89845.1 ribonuclease HII [Chitinibacter bivalviorum]
MKMLICGVDEAGRGPLAGSVFAAAVILPENWVCEGLTDSKKLSPKKREFLAEVIKLNAISWCVASATVDEIDSINILQATMLAMQRAIQGLSTPAEQALIDGNRVPELTIPAECIVKGDAKVLQISAASVLAKVAKDAEAMELDQLYPEYGFALHKGYGTALHLKQLKQYGASPCHRKTFAPVRAALMQTTLF